MGSEKLYGDTLRGESFRKLGGVLSQLKHSGVHDAHRQDLMHFIPTVSPHLEAPKHLKPITDLFERIANGESVRALISVSPQHGKSVTLLHGLVWLMQRKPHLRHAYAGYAQAFTEGQVDVAARVARNAQLAIPTANTRRWVLEGGGGVTWTSRGGPLTGRPVDGIMIYDDLLKDREEARSKATKRKAMSWLSSVAESRMHPGASFIGVSTRWALDDPHGQLVKTGNYEYINLPAIIDGKPLWDKRPLEYLEDKRQNMLPADWEALYMGNPLPDGAQVFGEPCYYDALPQGPYTEATGFDAAYTVSSSADYTVAVTGRRYGELLYVTDMIRVQASPDTVIDMLKHKGIRRVHWRRSGTEKGLEALLRREGVTVKATTASSDKLAASTPLAVAWNQGKILLPKDAPWTPIVIEECEMFTGFGSEHDDIVDALASLHGALAKTMPASERKRIAGR